MVVYNSVGWKTKNEGDKEATLTEKTLECSLPSSKAWWPGVPGHVWHLRTISTILERLLPVPF